MAPWAYTGVVALVALAAAWFVTSPASNRPDVHDVQPSMAVWGDYLYVLGENLANPGGSAWVTVTAETVDGYRDLQLEVYDGTSEMLAVALPPSDPLHFVGPVVKIEVATSSGVGTWSTRAITFTDDYGFGGAGGDEVLPGTGLLGEVYKLRPGVRRAPHMWHPCEDDDVVDSSAPCPWTTIIVPELNISSRDFSRGLPGLGGALTEWFAVRFTGTIDVPGAGSTGTHRFTLCSDDGSRMWMSVDEDKHVQVVDNDGVHSMRCASGETALSGGRYPITVTWFQGAKYQLGLELYWDLQDGEQVIVPRSSLSWLEGRQP